MKYPPRPEKFVLFAREGADWKQMVASAWEFDLEKPEAGLVRKAEFTRSHWDALPLCRGRDLAPEFVRLQVNNERTPNGYIVHLYRIDYRSWDVRLILKTDQVLELGVNPRDVFVATNQGYRIIDRRNGVIREFEVPFRVVRKLDDDLWIIELLRQATGRSGAFFDVTKGQVLDERFAVPAGLGDHNIELRLSPDRRRAVLWDRWYMDDPKSDALHEGARVLTTKLIVQDLKSGEKRSFPFRSLCRAGSGEAVLSMGPQSEWNAEGTRLTCLSLTGEDSGSKSEQVLLDAATMEVVERREPPEPKPWTPWKVQYLPDRMKAAYESLAEASAEHGRRVALAFLKCHGIDVREHLQYGSDLAFSSDGRRMLIRMRRSEGFYFGDLESDTMRLIPTPPALANISMNMIWVATPP